MLSCNAQICSTCQTRHNLNQIGTSARIETGHRYVGPDHPNTKNAAVFVGLAEKDCFTDDANTYVYFVFSILSDCLLM